MTGKLLGIRKGFLWLLAVGFLLLVWEKNGIFKKKNAIEIVSYNYLSRDTTALTLMTIDWGQLGSWFFARTKGFYIQFTGLLKSLFLFVLLKVILK